ncbi:MAG: hypothetical protein ABEH59_06805 [Halobacteriales archaeon]
MLRRRYLATGTAGVAAALAGCSWVLGGEVSLTNPETELQDGGREKYLVYSHADERIVTVGFSQRTVPASMTDRFGFRISVPHSDETSIESFRFDLRAPQSSVDPPADIYLESPAGGLWPDITYREVEDRWTRIALADTRELGEGTMTLETIVDPHSVPAAEVGLRVDLTLSTSESPPNRTYRVTTSTTFEPITGSS